MTTIKKIIIFTFCLFLTFVSCNNDDDVDGGLLPSADRADQELIESLVLINYLETHFVDSVSLANNSDPRINDIVIEELPSNGELPNPDRDVLLIDIVEPRTTIFQEVSYTYYILRIQQGGGDQRPNVSDDVLINFNGSLLDGEVFDQSITPIPFDLITVAEGLGRALTEFNTAESFEINSNGEVNFINPGIGVVFMTSGLGFFDSPVLGIPFFANLIFKFELFQTQVLDHDNDGIPSYLEDVNGDMDVENDDTDEDFSSNFLDTDDDDDNVPTIEEDPNGDGNSLNDDTDNDGIPNYLDEDDDNDGILTEDEDANGNNDPTDDDTDGDGIPDYLDPDS